MHKSKPKRIDSVLKGVLRKVGIYENFKIQSHWIDIVGKEIAAVTEPYLIENNLLEIRVKNTIWKRELESMESTIIKEINSFMRKKIIYKIVFKIGLRRRQI